MSISYTANNVNVSSNSHLHARIAELEQENSELKQEKRVYAEMFACDYSVLTFEQKLALYAIYPDLAGRDAFDEYPLTTWEAAKRVGMPTDTFLKCISHFEKLGIIGKRLQKNYASDGTVLSSQLHLSAKERLTYPRLYSTTEPNPERGGKRANAGRPTKGSPPRCKRCGRGNIDHIGNTICRDCNHVGDAVTTHYYHDSEQAEQQINQLENTVRMSLGDADTQNNQLECSVLNSLGDAEMEIEQEENNQLVSLPTPPQVPERQVDLLVDTIVLSNNPPPKSSLESFLLQRIGHGQLIYSTGSLITSDKYFSFKTGHVPELEKYLKGDREYIYGSRLALTDGRSTNVLSFDIDIKYPDLYARRMEFMLSLAAAGIAVCAWLRRDGSVHIEIYFSSPVDASAAYAFLCDVCPSLREIAECYPVNDKADCALSWPFYYRIDAKVFPCALEYIPAYGTSVKKHPGIVSDRNGLTAILAECVTPASLIPALPIVVEDSNNVTNMGGGLLDRTARIPVRLPYGCTSDGLGTAVIADWNASHSWEYVTGQTLCNGFFRSPFRTDSDPSVKVNANHTAKDFGPGGAYMDKFDWWIAFNHLDKTAEVKRLIAESKPIAS